jgi:hypothetical protein
MLLIAIYDMELDKVQCLIEEGKSTMSSYLLLLALGDKHMDVDFAIVRWLISNGHVDPKKELGILLDQYSDITVPLLRLVEIGEIDNIVSDDAYLIWTKETMYTTDFLRIMLPRSNPPRRILKQLLKNEGREKNLVLQLMESSRYSPPPPSPGRILSPEEATTLTDESFESYENFRRIVYEEDDQQYLRTVRRILDTTVGQETVEKKIVSVAALLAAETGSLMTLEYLMNCYPEIVPTAMDGTHWTILMLASEFNRTQVVEWILEDNSVDIHAINRFGQSAVGVVGFDNTKAILELLVNKGGANMADLTEHDNVFRILAHSDLETLKWIFRETKFPDMKALVSEDALLSHAIGVNALDRFQWIVEEGKSTVSTTNFLSTLDGDEQGPDFAIARWLISNGHVDAMKEFRNVIHSVKRGYQIVPRLLRLVEICELDNMEEEDASAMWKMGEPDYTTDFLRVMLPRSDPPPDVRTRLLQDETQKDIVLSGLELRKKVVKFHKSRSRVVNQLNFPDDLIDSVLEEYVGELTTDEMWNM